MMLTLLFASSRALAEEASVAPPIPPDARFALALYCNPRCDDTVLDRLDEALNTIPSDETFSEQVAAPSRIMGLGGVDFGIPDADFIATFGPDIRDPEALTRSEMVVLAWFASPREQAQETLATAHAAFAAAATRSGGWVEDLDTQLLFDAEGWRDLDPEGPLTDWFVVEELPAAADPTRVRLVTRGLRRFGDFELVVDGVAPEASTDVGWVLRAVAETLHPLPDVADEVPVDTEDARGLARLSVATPVEEDPQGPLLRVRFAGEVLVDAEPAIAEQGPDGSAPAGATGSSAAASGSAPTDIQLVAPAPPAPPAPPSSLEEATARVRKDLVDLEAAWDAGLPSGDVIAVNVPFRTRYGGEEYLWLEVTRWQDGGLSGKLVSEPYEVPGVRKGDVLNVRQADVYDYVYRKADGTRTGALTRAFR
jgi:uncharacterized protein YegJ (DUF2314 family)